MPYNIFQHYVIKKRKLSVQYENKRKWNNWNGCPIFALNNLVTNTVIFRKNASKQFCKKNYHLSFHNFYVWLGLIASEISTKKTGKSGVINVIAAKAHS